MKPVTLALYELRRFRGGPLRRLVPVALVLVPLLVGGIFLWANWDPYGKLDEIPVAVVNKDRPVSRDGHVVNVGEQFVRQLKRNDLFEWHFVGPEEAMEGLKSGRYYLTVTVPKHFSAALVTVGKPSPRNPSLVITKNDANGYLVGIMADTAQARLQKQINSAAQAAYARVLYGEIDAIREQLRRAADAAGGLIDGLELASKDAGNLASGLSKKAGAASRVAEAVQEISSTAQQLDSRLATASSQISQRMPTVVNTLAHATGTVAQGLTTLATSTAFMADTATDNVQGLQQLGRKYPQVRQDPTFVRVLRDSRQLADTAASARNESRAALDSAQKATERALALQNALAQLQTTMSTVTDSSSKLAGQATQLTGSVSSLSDGLSTLADNATTLEAGLAKLGELAKKLAGFVTSSLKQIPETNPAEVQRSTTVLGSPTELVERNLNPAKVYGRGLAPLFFGIALWAFALLAYMLLRPFNLRALGNRTNSIVLAVAGWLPVAALGFLAALILLAVLDLGIGLDPVNLGTTVALLFLAALTFAAIDQFLRAWLGPAGSAVSLFLLAVQIPASGGLYPIETTQGAFEVIHPAFPMTYLVDGLRVTISGGLTTELLIDLGVLAGFLIVFLMLSSLIARRNRTWTVGRLHPQVGG